MSLTTSSQSIYRNDNMPKLSCLSCGRPLRLVMIEPSDIDAHDQRTFECTECHVTETFMVKK